MLKCLKMVLHGFSGYVLEQKKVRFLCISRKPFTGYGRSMLEMLGVLAIIGVLSIGGLYAYRQAMMRHRINQTQDWFSRMRMAVNERCLDDVNACNAGGISTASYVKRQQMLCATAGTDFCFDLTPPYADFPYAPDTTWIVYYTEGERATSVYFTGLSKAYCEAFIQHDWAKLYSIADVFNNVVKTIPAKGKPLSQADKNTLKGACPFRGYFRMVFYTQD